MIVMGTAAYCGSGQDTLADEIVKRYGFTKYSMGDFIRAIAKDRSIKLSRENLQMIRKELDGKFDRSYIPTQIAGKILVNNRNIVITGLRTLEELAIFKKKLDLYFIFVFADKEIRFQRLLNRATDRDPVSRESFEKQCESESRLFDVAELEKQCDYHLECNMNLEEFQANAGKILRDIPVLRSL